ncbi:MAG: GxxExxY protein [Lentimonas sp.]
MKHEGHRGHEGRSFDALSNQVIKLASEGHKQLGPGLLESTYQKCLSLELKMAGISRETEAPIKISDKGVELDAAYRVDLLIDNSLIMGLKSVKTLESGYELQLLTYMKFSGTGTGRLKNFNQNRLKDGLKPMVL